MAMARGTLAGTRSRPPESATIPMVASGSANVACSAATIRSADSASSKPPPMAIPLTAAMTGLPTSKNSVSPANPPGLCSASTASPSAAALRSQPGAEEPFAGAGDDGNAQCRVVAELDERVVQLHARGNVDRVRLRHIEGDDKRRPTNLGVNGHRACPSKGRSSAREMMCRWISLVPSQIRSTRASRHHRSILYSRTSPMPPNT